MPGTIHRPFGRVLPGIACAAALTSSAAAQFTSSNVQLMDWIDLPAFGATSGAACWGYVSPSGREYALMGLRTKLAVVEITDPANAQIVGQVTHSESLWCEIKAYDTYAYVVNEAGGGLDVVDLSDVDNGVVTLVQRVTDMNLATSHTITVDPVSGYLYLNGSGVPGGGSGDLDGGRLSAWSLANPADPVHAGTVSASEGTYVHDSQVVTYTSGPYAGKQIAFCCNGGIGLDIYDVTDKANMFRLSRTTYPNLAYAHQAWLSEDRQHLYLNDELDNVNETVIFDVSDLSNPVVVGSSTSGVAAYDHNLFYRDGFIYEAEYHAGLRVFCAADPLHPVQVGWFDTYPADDLGNFDGAWHVYPFFPSGTVIISDINRGLFVVDVSDALVAGSALLSSPQGQPELVAPSGGTLQVELSTPCGGSIKGATVTLFYDAGGGFTSLPMQPASGEMWEATLPALPCPAEVAFYFSADVPGAGTFTDPAAAPGETYDALVAQDVTTVFNDDFDADLGWTAENLGATSGNWQRGVPVDDPTWSYDPATDGDGSGFCWLTQNVVGNSDVDGGAVRVSSPVFDMSQGGLAVAYEYFLRLTVPDGADSLVLEASSSGAAGPWTEIARHDTDGGLAWQHHDILPADFAAAGVAQTSTMKFRFTANDADPQSIVEAAIDGFSFTDIGCETSLGGDLDDDGLVNVSDLLIMLGAWGPCPGPCPPSCAADVNGDCQVGVTDLLVLLANWTL